MTELIFTGDPEFFQEVEDARQEIFEIHCDEFADTCPECGRLYLETGEGCPDCGYYDDEEDQY